jgi:hypothetical protein
LLQGTNISSSYSLTHRSQRGIKSAIESHHHLGRTITELLNARLRTLEIEIDRLLTEDILAGLHRAQDIADMGVGWRTDIQCFDAGEVDRFLKLRDHLASRHLDDAFCPFRILLEYAEKTGTGISYHISRMQLSDSSGSDQCDS